MRMIMFIVLTTLLSFSVFCQINLSEPKIIADSFDPRINTSIGVYDLDGDGDQDIAATDYSAFGEYPLLAWYSNNGQGDFTRHNIQTDHLSGEEHVSGTCLFIADVDSDQDPDIILGSFAGNNTIAWFENIDGIGNFSTFKSIKAGEGHHSCTYAADLDGDGDTDVLDSDWDGFELFTNTDGTGTFQKTTINNSSAGSLIAIDITNDGDLDIIAGFSNKIVWYENLGGNGQFSQERIITRDGYGFLYLADIDGDGDLDLLSAGENKAAWYENTNGQGLFGAPRTITIDINNAYAVCAADLDRDGDLDVLSGSLSDSKLAWYENLDGKGSFGPQNIIEHNYYGVAAVHTADLDGDGDPDIIVSTGPEYIDNQFIPGKIFWLQNNTLSASVDRTNDIIIDNFKLSQNYPNPFNPTTKITFTVPHVGISLMKSLQLKIFDILGREVITLVNSARSPGTYTIEWNGTNTAGQPVGSGIYYCRLQAGDFIGTRKLTFIK